MEDKEVFLYIQQQEKEETSKWAEDLVSLVLEEVK